MFKGRVFLEEGIDIVKVWKWKRIYLVYLRCYKENIIFGIERIDFNLDVIEN